MKAIILAAGYGKRMRPLTDHEHKTLLKINGRTIISRIVDGLLENGVTDIIVATVIWPPAGKLFAGILPSGPLYLRREPQLQHTNNIHSLSLVLTKSKLTTIRCSSSRI